MSEEVEKQEINTEAREPVSPAPTASKAEEHMIPKSRLDEEIAKRKAYEVQLKELEILKADKARREEAEMTESQRLQKQAEELKAHNEKLQADIMRRDVIAETGLPVFLAERLKGSNKDELLADAQELLKQLPQVKNQPKVSPTNPANGEMPETDAQKRARLFGSQGNVFDTQKIKESGGGVVWNK